MSFTVDDFHDFIRLIEARPEWRTELRRLVLIDELLAMPEQLAELRAHSEQQFIALVEAQQRTETRLTTLAEAQQHLETQMTTLTGQVTTLTVQVTALTRTVQTLVDDVGELKGQSLEAMYRSKGHAYFSRLLRRPHVLTPDELTALIEDARDRGVLSEVDARELYDMDLAVRGRRLEDSTEVFLVVEVSWGVGPHDVERAARRAILLAHAGLVTMAVVAGKRILPEAAALALQTQVWQVTDGQAIPPDAVSTSS
jgi:hypothetical protein